MPRDSSLLLVKEGVLVVSPCYCGDIDKRNPVCHALGETDVDGADLRVDVCQKRVAGSPADLFDGRILCTEELECHSTG